MGRVTLHLLSQLDAFNRVLTSRVSSLVPFIAKVTAVVLVQFYDFKVMSG